MSEWISVEDRLPELPGKNVVYETVSLLVTDGRFVGICDYQWGNGAGTPWSAWSNYGDIPAEFISHWMPKPEPPQ